MSAASQPTRAAPGQLLDTVSNTFWSLGVIAEIGSREATLGDLVAISYSARRTLALTRLLTSCVAELRELAESQSREIGRDDKVFTQSEPSS